MKILVVVDANIIMSALLGGKAGVILFDPRFEFVTTEFTLKEVKKYFPRLESKTGISKEELLALLEKLPLQTYKQDFYQDDIQEADSLVGHIDKKDIDILALSLKLKSYLWSQDKHFEKSGYIKILKTYDFL